MSTAGLRMLPLCCDLVFNLNLFQINRENSKDTRELAV